MSACFPATALVPMTILRCNAPRPTDFFLSDQQYAQFGAEKSVSVTLETSQQEPGESW